MRRKTLFLIALLMLFFIVSGTVSLIKIIRIHVAHSTTPPASSYTPVPLTSLAGSYPPLIYNYTATSWTFSSMPSNTNLVHYRDVGVYGTNYIPDRHNDTTWSYTQTGLSASWNTASINPEDAYSARFTGTGSVVTNFTTPVTNLPNNVYFATAIAVLNNINFIKFTLKNTTHQITIEFYYAGGTFITIPSTSLMDTMKPVNSISWFYYVFNVTQLWESQYGTTFQGGNYTAEYYLQGSDIDIGINDMLLDFWYLGDSIQYGASTVNFNGNLDSFISAPTGRTAGFNLSTLSPLGTFDYPTALWLNVSIPQSSDPINLTLRTTIFNDSTYITTDIFTIINNFSIDLITYFNERIDTIRIDSINLWNFVSGTTYTTLIDDIAITGTWIYHQATLTNMTTNSIDYLPFPYKICQIDRTYKINYDMPFHRTWFIVFNTSVSLINSLTISDTSEINYLTHANATVVRFNLTTLPSLSAGNFIIKFRDYTINIWEEINNRVTGGGSGYYTESALKVVGVDITTTLNDPPILYTLANFTTPIQIYTEVYEDYGVFRDINGTQPAAVNFSRIQTGVIHIDAVNITAPNEIFYIRGTSSAPTIEFITPKMDDILREPSFTISIHVSDTSGVTNLEVWHLGNSENTETTLPLTGTYDPNNTLYDFVWNGTVTVGSFTDGERRIVVEATDQLGFTIRTRIYIHFQLGTFNNIIIVSATAGFTVFCVILAYKAMIDKRRNLQKIYS